jgi:hypothetical protein
VAAVPVASPEWVREQLVGLLDGTESRFIAGGAVGVKALGETPVSGLDLTGVCAAEDAQDAIGVAGRSQAGHGRRSVA